ncbi:MAG: lysophospholipid acyltransferase family protein [Verrucomicrobiales bacterium]|jgi:KDO2-lipid IV(A) lauroyltransferase
MSRSKTPTISHRLEYLVYRGLEWAIQMMSLETTFKVGEFAGRFSHRILKTRRRQVIRNLTYAFGNEKSREEIENLASLAFERIGANFLTAMKIPFLKDEEILRHVGFVGLDALERETEKGGIVLVSPHMGNWELLAQVLFLTPNKITVGTHYRPLNNSLINAVVERRRKRRGLKLFPKRASTHKLTSFVREGAALGILADQRVGSRGAASVFFGRPTTCSPLPHLIAKRGKGQLIGLHCRTVGTCRWEVHFNHIEEMTAQACAENLEEAWRSSPEDVFWFEDRWRIQGKEPLKFLEKYGDNHGVSRPLRLVNLTPTRPAFDFPSDILAEERADLNFNDNDMELTEALSKIEEEGPVAPDIFVCPARHQSRLRKLSRKTQVLSVFPLPAIRSKPRPPAL